MDRLYDQLQKSLFVHICKHISGENIQEKPWSEKCKYLNVNSLLNSVT